MFPWFWILLAVELGPATEASGRYKSYDYYMYYCGNGVAVERERICDGVSDCQVRTSAKSSFSSQLLFGHYFSRMTNLTAAPPDLSAVATKVIPDI